MRSFVYNVGEETPHPDKAKEAAGPSGSSSESQTLMELHGSIARLSRQILNPGDLYQAVCEEAVRIFGADSAVVLSCSAESRTGFSVRAQSDPESSSLPSDQLVLASAFKDLEHGDASVLSQEGTDPAYSLPQRGTPNALLVLRGKPPEFLFDAGRLQIARIFGDLVSIAIENAEMFERVSVSQREWENTFDSISDPIYIVDNEYRLRKMNKSRKLCMNIKLPRDNVMHTFNRNQLSVVPPFQRNATGAAVTVRPWADGIWQINHFPYTDKSDSCWFY